MVAFRLDPEMGSRRPPPSEARAALTLPSTLGFQGPEAEAVRPTAPGLELAGYQAVTNSTKIGGAEA